MLVPICIKRTTISLCLLSSTDRQSRHGLHIQDAQKPVPLYFPDSFYVPYQSLSTLRKPPAPFLHSSNSESTIPVRFSPLQRISPIRYNIGCHKNSYIPSPYPSDRVIPNQTRDCLQRTFLHPFPETFPVTDCLWLFLRNNFR